MSFVKTSFFNVLYNREISSFSLVIGLGTRLFVKVPRPEDSEGTFSVFELSCHLLLPV